DSDTVADARVSGVDVFSDVLSDVRVARVSGGSGSVYYARQTRAGFEYRVNLREQRTRRGESDPLDCARLSASEDPVVSEPYNFRCFVPRDWYIH
ncbi:hypothetical protein X777_02515, partial [Ooceraea biroi]